jgi:hypothetical protein
MATLECEALAADVRGAPAPRADCELPVAGAPPDGELRPPRFPEVGTSGVTRIGAVVVGATPLREARAGDSAVPAAPDVGVWLGPEPGAEVAVFGEEVDARAPGLFVTGLDGPAVAALFAGEVGGVVDGVGGGGCIGDATTVGEVVGGGGATGVVGRVGAGAVLGVAAKKKAFPVLSTAAHDGPDTHEMAFRFPRRSRSVGADHAVPSSAT